MVTPGADATVGLHRPVVGFQESYATLRARPTYVILGVQGSGTNLLGRLLIRVFGFSLVRDRSLLFNAAVRLGKSPSDADVAREIAGFHALLNPSTFDRIRGKKFIRQREPFEGISAELTSATVRSGADFLRIIYAYRAHSLGLQHMAIKSDDIWEHLHEIDTVLPNKRIVLLTRDFRDNLLSVGGKHFGPVEPICAARYVKRQFQVYDREYRRSGGNGLHVRFETLVESPRRFVDDFASHFGVDPVVDPEEVLAAFRFRPNKIAKWKSLDSQTLAWCEGLLKDELQTYGYPLASSDPTSPSRRTMLAATARDAVRRVPQKLRQIAGRIRG